MKTRRFDFNYRPLQINKSLSEDGSVPGVQNYDADTNTYTPDYTLTPLILQPRISLLDKDDILQAGPVNHLLANVRWYEIVNGVETLITTSNTDYEVVTAGSNAGRIKVKKNANPQQPIPLHFKAELPDMRTGQLYVIEDTYLVKCNSATESFVLLLDCADQTIYNPLEDVAMQRVHATLKQGIRDCSLTNCFFIWEILNDSDVWEDARSADMAYFITFSTSKGEYIDIDRSLMGEIAQLRCRALYDRDGNPTTVATTADMPTQIKSFVRRIPKYEYDVGETPTNIPNGVLAISPKAEIWNTNGPITDPERELLPLWYMATNKASGSLSYTQIGHGVSPTLPTALMSTTLGGVVGLDVKDRGAWSAWEDESGNLITDDAGNVILLH